METFEKSKQIKWTQEYTDLLTELSYKYTDKKIAQTMTNTFGIYFSMVAVRRKRNKLGLAKFGGKKPGIKKIKDEQSVLNPKPEEKTGEPQND